MKVIIKKFSLRRNGKIYKTGEVVNLPGDEAKALVLSNPEEFGFVDDAVKNDHVEAVPVTAEPDEAAEEAEEEIGLPDPDFAALVKK